MGSAAKSMMLSSSAIAVLFAAPAAAEWRPSKPIEFVATAGPGGGTDNLARTVQSIIHLAAEPMFSSSSLAYGATASGHRSRACRGIDVTIAPSFSKQSICWSSNPHSCSTWRVCSP